MQFKGIFFKGREAAAPGFTVFRVVCLLWLFGFIDDDERRTLGLPFLLRGEDNIAVTDGLWVIWALLLLSILVDYFHTKWHEWNQSILHPFMLLVQII